MCVCVYVYDKKTIATNGWIIVDLDVYVTSFE